MQRLGLALSGGGFRAALYHLGVVRFLRDAGLLGQVTHITSVSGGSVLGAHLVLNWDRYCGSDDEFQAASDELLRFLQMDVRNRIVRRFPLASLANVARRSLRMSTHRQFTRAGLLEQHYEKFLYGDTSLFSLPENPKLYILATNLSEGSLCAFHREGLLLQRRDVGRHDRFEQLRIGLATVPMAVAASSAFPGFFPPLELRNWEVGEREGEFNRHSFTDGGIFDNIGLRMFRKLQQISERNESVPEIDDVIDARVFTSAITSGNDAPETTPIRRLWDKLLNLDPDVSASRSGLDPERSARFMIEGLGSIIRNDELYRDPVFQKISLSQPTAKSLLESIKSSPDKLDLNDHIWLNRQLVDWTLEQAAGRPCLRSGTLDFSGILVSNAGASFKVKAEGGRAGGLLSTAMRSSDILMDRVNQMELESFHNAPGVIFFPITSLVQHSLDPHAPHPEIQRQASLIRTDMDAFSDLEVTALVQHGYCVARQVCRDTALLPTSDIPCDPPWNPLEASHDDQDVTPLCDTSAALDAARELQKSSSRRIVSTLLSFTDWPTYLWVPLAAVLMLTLPYLLYKANDAATQRGYVLSAISETSPLYRKILALIDNDPIYDVTAVEYEDVKEIEPADFSGFEFLSDNRIFDLRGWTAESTNGTLAPYVYSRIRVRRTSETDAATHLRLQTTSGNEELYFNCLTKSLRPRYRRIRKGDGQFLWEVDLDFSNIRVGTDAEVVFDGLVIGEYARDFGDGGRFQFSILADTGLAETWMLMPTDRKYENFQIIAWPIDEPERSQTVVPTTHVELPIGSIATFQLINPKHNYRYECRWNWVQESD